MSAQGATCALEFSNLGKSRWHFQDTGRFVVTSGMPVGEEPAVSVSRLREWALARGKIPIICGCEPADLPHLEGWKVREIGRQPLFEPSSDYTPELSGPAQPARGREMRRQARRALSKGAEWQEAPAGRVWELEQAGALNHLLLTRWQRQPLAEFSFLVALHLAPGQDFRRYFLLRSESAVLGLAILVACERGWLVEHQLLDKEAPNGSGELLVCRLLSAHLEPDQLLSLGITPLYRALVPDLPHRERPGILSFMPDAARSALLAAWEPLYGFRRLQTYREKLEPAAWEPVYWAHARGLPPQILWAVLRAFAGGSVLGFAAATAEKVLAKKSLRIPGWVLRATNAFFVVTLCLWIPILWQLDGEWLFASALAPKIWAIFDIFLVLGFVRHGSELRREKVRHRVGPFLLGLVSADALLSVIWMSMLHSPLPTNPASIAFLLALTTAPLCAVIFLLICLSRRPHFLRHGGRLTILENS